jgi:NADPH:quinone reductase
MIRVTRSTVINAPIDRVWSVLRDFNSHTAWHPVVAESEIEGDEPSDRVGCIRRFRLQDGARIREQLLSLSDRDYRMTYCILSADIPLERYVATVQLKPVTDGDGTFWHWQSTFRAPRGREEELADIVGNGVYEAGFAGVAKMLAERGTTTMPRIATRATARSLAMVFDRAGGPEVLVARELEVRAPQAGEVRIRHSAIGINYLDIYIRSGLAPLAQPGEALGVEAVGVVVDVGESVTHIMPGDRVAYLGLPTGSYSDLRTLSAAQVVPLPANVDDERAAAAFLKGLTAEYLLHRIHVLKPGEVVLVHAAAGGLGVIAASWARSLGATVIGTVSSEEKARLARDHGCHHVVVTRDYVFADTVIQASGGHGADLIVDGLGQQAMSENIAALAMFGHWVSVGHASGGIAAVDPHALLAKSATFSAPAVLHYTSDPTRLAQMADRLWNAIQSGAARPYIGARYPLAAAREAHRDLESRTTRGSLLLIP